MGELIDVAEVSYCSGCDWIVQEWHEAWETHNSKPYDDEAACDLALAEQARRDRDLGLRCIHEADMTQGLCEQALWYVLKDEPYERYRCVYGNP